MEFRRLESSDIVDCSTIVTETWPWDMPGLTSEETMVANEWYVRLSLLYTDWAQLVINENEVIGFMFGSIPSRSNRPKFISLIRRTISVGKSFLFLVKKIPRLITLCPTFLLTEFKLMLLLSESEACIQLFIVKENYRGKGIGKELLDRFVYDVRRNGINKIAVYTEDKTSNWRFYERYGFRKEASFYDNFISKVNGERTIGYIYSLAVQP